MTRISAAFLWGSIGFNLILLTFYICNNAGIIFEFTSDSLLIGDRPDFSAMLRSTIKRRRYIEDPKDPSNRFEEIQDPMGDIDAFNDASLQDDLNEDVSYNIGNHEKVMVLEEEAIAKLNETHVFDEILAPTYEHDWWVKPTIFVQYGAFWVAYDIVKATNNYEGNQSITLTTPTDYTNLDNLVPLVRRWRGPISCAVFAPGYDYLRALNTIHYLQKCNPLVKKLVTFHLFFPRKHIPRNLWNINSEYYDFATVDCSQGPPVNNSKPYRHTKNLEFPINVARNIARSRAHTHFVFASDIELFPSSNFIPEFLKMVSNKRNIFIHSPQKKVFVLPVFELSKEVKQLPGNKMELRSLFDKKLAILFHKFICSYCHNIPDLQQWVRDSKSSSDLGVYAVTKRLDKLKYWEPFYVGTKNDPTFDERVTWDGGNNKKIQAFVMCLLDYDFHVLDNAFLVHRPGIKHKTVRSEAMKKKSNALISRTIIPELNKLYGQKKVCRV